LSVKYKISNWGTETVSFKSYWADTKCQASRIRTGKLCLEFFQKPLNTMPGFGIISKMDNNTNNSNIRSQITGNFEGEFGFIFFLHLFIIIFVYLSPVLVNWKIIILLTLLSHLQLMLVGSCILSKIQFKNTDRRPHFFHYYLSKIGIYVHPRKLSFIQNYIIPTTLIFTALVLQTVLGLHPILF